MLTARVHDVVRVEPGTVMVKVIPQRSVARYLAGEVSAGEWGRRTPFDAHEVSGTVARLQDTTTLRGPADFFQAFRLDYDGSPFAPVQPVIAVMEFAAQRPAQFVVAYGAPTVPDLSVGLPEVRETAYAMVEAVEAAGVDPNTYRMEIAPWPYAGTGLSAGGALALPVWSKQSGPIPREAVIVEHDNQGRSRRIAMYAGRTKGWQDLR